MEKIDIGTQGFLYPMPVTLVGADLVAGMNKAHATNAGIHEHEQFSVCLPDVDQVQVTDWCGLNSARRGVEKASKFTVFRGALDHAPMIAECPLCLECRLYQTVDLGSQELFVADVVGTWAEERFLLPDGKPDIDRLRPFVLTMPDNRYWSIGEHIADAWSIGREGSG